MNQNSCSKQCLHLFRSSDLHLMIVSPHFEIDGTCIDLVELQQDSIPVEVHVEVEFQDSRMKVVVVVAAELHMVVADDLAVAFAL